MRRGKKGIHFLLEQHEQSTTATKKCPFAKSANNKKTKCERKKIKREGVKNLYESSSHTPQQTQHSTQRPKSVGGGEKESSAELSAKILMQINIYLKC